MPVRPLPNEDLEHILINTSSIWNEAKGKSFFITGGTGFFGFWLLESFAYINDRLELGMSACVLTRDVQKFRFRAPHLANRLDLNFVEGDIRTFKYPVGDFTYVIHAATETNAKYNKAYPQDVLDTIIGGTKHVLEFCQKASVCKILITSSGAVYGPQPFDISKISEEYLNSINPDLHNIPYAYGKRVAEDIAILDSKNRNYEVKIARCFAFVGPHLPIDGHFAIGNFIRDAISDKNIRIQGDGSTYRSYLYASDLAIWLWTILFAGRSKCPYNVGSDHSLDIAELADLVLKSLKKESFIEIANQRQIGLMPTRYVPDISRAKQELKLEVKIPLSLAISKTASWYSD